VPPGGSLVFSRNIWNRHTLLLGSHDRKLSIGRRLLSQQGLHPFVFFCLRKTLKVDGVYEILSNNIHGTTSYRNRLLRLLRSRIEQ
jgi:hypothetical protein